MEMDLFADLAGTAERELNQMGFSPDSEADDEILVRHWLNVGRRLAPQMKWAIKESNELKERKEELRDREGEPGEDILEGLEMFNERARQGQPLTPHASRGLKYEEESDELLYEWGIMHFHLGTDIQADGFVERTGPLLFAVLDASDAVVYLLDILGHDDFARQDLIDIIERNWPGLLDDYELEGVEVEGGYTDEEIEKFREIGVNTVVPTEEGRAVISMGGGLTSAGTSASDQRWINGVKRCLEDVESAIRDNREELEERFRSEHDLSWGDLAFRLTEFDDTIQVREEQTDEVVYEKDLS